MRKRPPLTTVRFTGSHTSIEDVRREVLRVVARQKRGGPRDVSRFSEEIASLLASVLEFQPEWKTSPCVYRVARLETDEGIVPFEDNVVLPDVKHTYELVIEMLGHIRAQKDLDPVRMPLFLHPDEIVLAVQPPPPEEPENGYRPTVVQPEWEHRPRRPRRLRRRPSWTKTRQAVLDRDDWTCQQCGATKDLHLYRLDGGRDEFDPAAYVTLCRHCLLRTERGKAAPQAEWQGLRPEDASNIRSQLALVFQKGKIKWIGFVFDRNYVVLED